MEKMNNEEDKHTYARIKTYHADIDERRWANAKKRRAFWADAESLDDGLLDENGDSKEDRCLGDGGVGADRIRYFDEEMSEPAWLELMHDAVEQLEEGSRIHRFYMCLLKDLRLAVAARNAGISRMQAYRYLAQFRELFAPAYTAWKANH